MKRFADLFGINESTDVLDIGGNHLTWLLLQTKPRLTLLDLRESSVKVPWAAYLVADGCATNLPDRAFDVVFSNSVIEHVGNEEKQKKFARECMRCGRGYFVQTPCKWFPVDPHTLMPFIHWLPKRMFNALMWISPRFIISRPSEDDIEDFRNMRLLGKKELQQLFPGATIIEERFCGIPKSLIAYSLPTAP